MRYLLLLVFFISIIIGIQYLANKNRVLGLLIVLISLFSIYLIIFPNSSTLIANYLGVGRGTDLLLYILFLISIIGLLLNFIKINRYYKDLTKLARYIALRND